MDLSIQLKWKWGTLIICWVRLVLYTQWKYRGSFFPVSLWWILFTHPYLVHMTQRSQNESGSVWQRSTLGTGFVLISWCCLDSNCFPTETTTPLAGLNHGAQGASITPFHSGVIVRLWFTALDNLPKTEHNGPVWEVMGSLGLQSQPLSSVVNSQNARHGRIIIFCRT